MSGSTAAQNRLRGKTVLVTGASSGIGRATALEFARAAPNHGLRLILTARRLDRLHELADEITRETATGFKVEGKASGAVTQAVGSGEEKTAEMKSMSGVQVLPVQLDISRPEEIKEFVGRLPEEWRTVDVLVNNAGLVRGVAQAPNIAEEDIKVMLDTNVAGLVHMAQAVLPLFKARHPEVGGRGDIINIGSIAGREPYVGGSIYCATKAFVRSFTESLRKELVATRIRVMEVDPGQVETEFSVVRYYGDKAKADAVYKGVEPLTPEDVAEVIVFVATRRENVVVADTLIFPSHQGGATVVHRKS